MTASDLASGQWTADRARAWHAARPWICGFNFLPSSAVNFIEMWRAETFDPETIARELAWAGAAGLNAQRTNLHFLVWKHDREGLLSRIEQEMDIAWSNGIITVLCPFDDCGFGGQPPVYGPQPDPVPGLHNSRAVASPGREAVMDRNLRPQFRDYLQDIVSRFGRDERVLFWDLYNEPTNPVIMTPEGFVDSPLPFAPHSHALMRDAFEWARETEPQQPLTVAPWLIATHGSSDPSYTAPFERDALRLSDIVTFHAYASRAHVAQIIEHLSAFRRPMMATEWMARSVDSRIGDQLALFHDRGVGCFQWGLVRGRTQTHLPWPGYASGHAPQSDATDTWFHDLFHPDGTPYDPDEIAIIRRLTQGQPRPAQRSQTCQV